MQNVSRRAMQVDRAPSRIPRRGAAAAIGTVAGLALLLSFRTPEALPLSGLGLGTVSGLGAGLGSDPTATDPPRNLAIAIGPKPTPNPTPTPDATHRGHAATAAPTPTDTPAPTPSKQVIDGKVVNTHYGPVQVEVTIAGGKVVDVQALQLPNDRQYSAEISNYVAPYLRKMALRAQSANIDIISGATYTSMGYARSLQSALNAAK
jgi:uncharacterized protein with FMN-binding domain